MDLRRTAITLCTLVSLATPQFSCQNSLEIKLEKERAVTQVLKRKIEELRFELKEKDKKTSEEERAIENSYKENAQLLRLKNREEYLFKKGSRISRFKNPNSKQDILLEINMIDHMNARAIPFYQREVDNKSIEPDNKYIKALLIRLGLPTKEPEEDAQKILNFVQSIPYLEDTEQYTKTVTETLAENSGDCEEHAILAVSMLRSINTNSVLVPLIDPKISKYVHCGIAVCGNFQGIYFQHRSGKKYFYAETTNDSEKPEKFWKIGQYPPSLIAYIPKINTDAIIGSTEN